MPQNTLQWVSSVAHSHFDPDLSFYLLISYTLSDSNQGVINKDDLGVLSRTVGELLFILYGKVVLG